jgi:hypothetical protein
MGSRAAPVPVQWHMVSPSELSNNSLTILTRAPHARSRLDIAQASLEWCRLLSQGDGAGVLRHWAQASRLRGGRAKRCQIRARVRVPLCVT